MCVWSPVANTTLEQKKKQSSKEHYIEKQHSVTNPPVGSACTRIGRTRTALLRCRARMCEVSPKYELT